MNEEQRKLFKVMISWYRSSTYDTISDYGDLKGHKEEIVQMKRELEVLKELEVLYNL